jgi:hypothetical protein
MRVEGRRGGERRHKSGIKGMRREGKSRGGFWVAVRGVGGGRRQRCGAPGGGGGGRVGAGGGAGGGGGGALRCVAWESAEA